MRERSLRFLCDHWLDPLVKEAETLAPEYSLCTFSDGVFFLLFPFFVFNRSGNEITMWDFVSQSDPGSDLSTSEAHKKLPMINEDSWLRCLFFFIFFIYYLPHFRLPFSCPTRHFRQFYFRLQQRKDFWQLSCCTTDSKCWNFSSFVWQFEKKKTHWTRIIKYFSFVFWNLIDLIGVIPAALRLTD